jgi:hypothetical protein
MADHTNRTLRPFRDYDEHDVINLFRLSGAAENELPVHRGTLVTFADNDGWTADREDGINMLGGAGLNSIGGVVSQRYGVHATVKVAQSTQQPIGMTLYDVRETDENGELLIHNPRKAVEMECVLSGQAVPIVTRGIFLYSGALLASNAPNAGADLFCGNLGEITSVAGTIKQVGFALGKKDGNGHVLISLNIVGHPVDVNA